MFSLLNCLSYAIHATLSTSQPNQFLPNTSLLTLEEDIASHLVSGVDRFLLSQLEESISKREGYWKRDFSSAANYSASITVKCTVL